MVDIIKSKTLAIVDFIFIWCRESNGVVKRAPMSSENWIMILIMQ